MCESLHRYVSCFLVADLPIHLDQLNHVNSHHDGGLAPFAPLSLLRCIERCA